MYCEQSCLPQKFTPEIVATVFGSFFKRDQAEEENFVKRELKRLKREQPLQYLFGTEIADAASEEALTLSGFTLMTDALHKLLGDRPSHPLVLYPAISMTNADGDELFSGDDWFSPLATRQIRRKVHIPEHPVTRLMDLFYGSGEGFGQNVTRALTMYHPSTRYDFAQGLFGGFGSVNQMYGQEMRKILAEQWFDLSAAGISGRLVVNRQSVQQPGRNRQPLSIYVN